MFYPWRSINTILCKPPFWWRSNRHFVEVIRNWIIFIVSSSLLAQVVMRASLFASYPSFVHPFLLRHANLLSAMRTSPFCNLEPPYVYPLFCVVRTVWLSFMVLLSFVTVQAFRRTFLLSIFQLLSIFFFPPTVVIFPPPFILRYRGSSEWCKGKFVRYDQGRYRLVYPCSRLCESVWRMFCSWYPPD